MDKKQTAADESRTQGNDREYLFHYTNITNLAKILGDQTLLFNNINKTNDPYENKIFDINTFPKHINAKNDGIDDDLDDNDGESFSDDDFYEMALLEFATEANDIEDEDDDEEEDDEDDEENEEVSAKETLTEEEVVLDEIKTIEEEEFAHNLFDSYFNNLDNNSYYDNFFYSEKKEDENNKRIEKEIHYIYDSFVSTYYNYINEIKNGIIKTISFSMGNFSLNIDKERNGYQYPRMWSQYGDNSSGACIVFRKDELIKEIIDKLKDNFYIYNDPIRYVDIFSEKHTKFITRLISERNIKFSFGKRNERKNILVKNLKKNIKAYFFRKDDDWKGEKEYRILILNKENNNDFDHKIIPINISKVVKCVVLGENFTIEDGDEKSNVCSIRNIYDLCKLYKISLHKLNRDFRNGKYWVMKF